MFVRHGLVAGLLAVLLPATVHASGSAALLTDFAQIRLDSGAVLEGAVSLALSPDGSELYVAGGSSLLVLDVDPGTGELSERERFRNNEGGVSGLRGAISVAVTPEFARAGARVWHVYVAGFLDAAVAVFEREEGTEGLTFVEALSGAQAGVSLVGAAAVEVSSVDALEVYVSSINNESLVAFARDPESGTLTFEGHTLSFDAGFDPAALASALFEGGDTRIVQLYVAGFGGNALALVERRTVGAGITARESFEVVEVLREGRGGVEGLVGATGLALDILASTQLDVLAGAFLSDAVSSFFVEVTPEGVDFFQIAPRPRPGLDGLDGTTTVAVRPTTGSPVYAGSCIDGAIVLFDRDLATGVLELREAVFPTGLSGVQSLTVSLDGRNLYVADRAGVAHFPLEADGGLMLEGGLVDLETPLVSTPAATGGPFETASGVTPREERAPEVSFSILAGALALARSEAPAEPESSQAPAQVVEEPVASAAAPHAPAASVEVVVAPGPPSQPSTPKPHRLGVELALILQLWLRRYLG